MYHREVLGRRTGAHCEDCYYITAKSTLVQNVTTCIICDLNFNIPSQCISYYR